MNCRFICWLGCCNAWKGPFLKQRFQLFGSCEFTYRSVICPAIFRGPKPACLHRVPESSHVSSWCNVCLLCSLQHRHRRAGSRYALEHFGLMNLRVTRHLNIELHLCWIIVILPILSVLFIRIRSAICCINKILQLANCIGIGDESFVQYRDLVPGFMIV